MSTTNGIQFACGGAAFMSGDVDETKEWLAACEEAGVKILDAAELYGAAEEVLGKVGAASKFTIDTKFPGGFTDLHATAETLIEHGKASLKRLNTDSVDVYYMHSPDRRVPIKDTLTGLNELYKQGAFKRLGLSNFLADEVEEVVRVAKENNFVIPSVYQGNYNAVTRRAEEELFPVLRKHNFAFYAYSPIAGGLLAKTKATLTEPNGRFGEGQPFAVIYNGMYNKPSFVAMLDVWEQIAKDEGVSRTELGYRWVVYHSELRKGDVVIIGARNISQFKETVQSIKAGPLSEAAVKKINEIWKSVKDDAPLDILALQEDLGIPK